MSSFGSGSTTTAGASITLRAFSGTDGQTAGTDGLVPGPAIAQQGYVLGAGGDWVLSVKAIDDLNESSTRIATTNFVQTLIGQAQLGGGNANLSALGDVSFANLATGQFLQYNANNDNNWSNVTLNLGTISDVDLAGLQDGNALVYSAAAFNGAGGWVPGEGGGGGAATLNGLGDVTINGGADKHFLVRNGDGQYVNRLISTADLSNSADIILRDGTVAFTGNVDLGTNNITNVSAITIPDNNANSLVIKEGNNNYLRFNSLNGSESIILEKDTAFNQRVDFNNTVVINEAGNGIDFRVETGTQTHAIFTDGGNDRVGIFQDTPTVPLDVVGDTKIDGNIEITGTITSTDLLEKARDAAGTALADGQHTGIAFVNDDENNRINATVDITGFSIRDLSDVSNDALVNGKILKVVNGSLTQANETDTNTQLSDEQVQDIVGAMVDGGTETDITVSYDDGAGKLNFVVDNTIARLNNPDLTGTPTAPTAAHDTNTTQLATTAFVLSQIAGSDINVLEGIDTAGKAPGKILKFNAQNNLVVADDDGKTQEEIEEIVGAMVDGNTETGITVSYVDNDDNAGKLNFVVDDTTVAFLGGVQTFTGNKTFQGNVVLGANATATTQAQDNNSTSVATTAFVHSLVDADIAALNLANTYQAKDASLDTITGIDDGDLLLGSGANTFEKVSVTPGVETILKGSGSVSTLSDISLQAGAIGDVLRVSAVGEIDGVANVPTAFVNVKLGTSDLSDGSNVVLDNAGAAFGAFDYNFTGANSITVPAPNNGADATTKTYVDTQVATKQGLDGTLTALAGLATGAKKIIYSNTGNDDLEMTDLSDNAKAFIASNAELGNLDKVTIAGDIGVGNDGEALRWDGANQVWKNSKLAFGDLNTQAQSTQNVALLNQEQTFTNNITFQGNVVLGANATATTQGNADDSTKVATTAFVKAVVNQVGNVSDLDDLTDVVLGVIQEDGVDVGVAVASGQVLRISGVDNGVATFKNTQLAYTDLSGTPVIGQDVQAQNATLQGISALQPVPANRFLYTTDEDTFGEGTINQVGLDILADANASEVRGTIGAQQADDTLTALAGLNTGVKQLIYSNTGNDDLEMTGLSDLGKTFIASSAGMNDLSDVAIQDLANAQILVADITDDGDDTNDKFKNVSLSGDITILKTGAATIANDAITTVKINDDAVTNAKLQNSYVSISDGTNSDNLSLGDNFTIKGVANETTIALKEDVGGGFNNANVELTIGLPADVTISNDLTVTGNLIVNGTTTTVSTEQLTIEDPVVVLNDGDAANDVGYFFTNPGAAGDQIFIFDNTDQIFKMAQVPDGKGAGDGEDSNFNPTVYSGLKIGALTATSGSFSSLLNADGGIEIDNNGNKFTVSTAGAVVSVGGITDTTTASAFATGTTIGDIQISNGQIQTTANDNNLSFNDNNLSTSGNLTINTDKFVVTGATGNLAINTNKFTVDGATGNTLVAGTLGVSQTATFTAGLSANDQNITNVADIALDSISAAGDAIAIVLDDKVDSALVIREGNNNYITVDTTDNAELITFEKNVQFNGTTNITPDYDQAITINDSGNDVDFRVEGSGQTHLLFTDGGNNRVGINTATPATQLHVIGDNTFEGAITHNSGAVVFNSDAENFDFNVKGDTEANLFYVDASADKIGIGKNNPSKVLDITGDVGISTTLDVTGKTTLAGSLDLTTNSNTGITFRSEIADQGADANQTLLRVNTGGGGPVYKSIKWVAASDLFEVESGLKSTGNFTVGADAATFNATTGAVGLTGTTTINNADGTADLIVQDNGVDVFNVDASTGITTITGQLKTDDLRAKTAGTDNFKVVLEDGIPNALEIYDDSIANESYLLFNTQGEKMDFGKEVNFNSRANFITSLSLQSGVNSGVKYNSNLENAVSQDATLMTIEGGTNKSDVVLRWDTSEDEINLNSEAILHIQGKNQDSALTIGGATGQAANITMTTAGAITLAGTLDSPTINTNKITNKNDTSLVVELADTEPSALVIREGNNGESYLTIDTDALTTTLTQATSFSSTVDITGDATLDASLKIKYIDGLTTPLILANSDRTGNGDEADALLIEIERGEEANAKIKWDETSDVFEFDKTLSAEANFQVGIDAAAPKATINSTTGDLSTDGTISATSSITTDSVLNFTTASQGAIVFNSDLGVGEAPDDADDFGLTVNRGNTTDAKLYWDEGDDAWKIETGNVQVQNSLVVDSDAAGKITISDGSIVSASGAIDFGNENLSTTGTIDAATPNGRGAEGGLDDSTQVATTEWVLDLRLGDFDQVDTTGFNANDQVLIWDQDNNNFKAGTAVYAAENARDDVGAALVKGSIIDGVLNDVNGASTGADTISFTLDDANDIINLALGISSGNLTDISTDAPANNQVLRFTTAEGGNQNKYVPTTLGTAADVDTGLDNGNVPVLSTHFHSTKTNETADLVVTGRIIESIDYGLVSEAYNENTDWAIDFGSITDTGISSWEDYGQLVV